MGCTLISIEKLDVPHPCKQFISDVSNYRLTQRAIPSPSFLNAMWIFSRGAVTSPWIWHSSTCTKRIFDKGGGGISISYLVYRAKTLLYFTELYSPPQWREWHHQLIQESGFFIFAFMIHWTSHSSGDAMSIWPVIHWTYQKEELLSARISLTKEADGIWWFASSSFSRS